MNFFILMINFSLLEDANIFLKVIYPIQITLQRFQQ